VPIFLGAAIAWRREGLFDLPLFLLTLAGGILLHAGANVANDYFDHKSGNDEVNVDFVRPFTGGSRMIQTGKMKPSEVLAEAIVCYALAAAIGIYLSYKVSWLVLLLGLIGIFSGLFYTAPPFRLVHRGIGELFIGLNFGLLMTLGAYLVQTGRLSWEPVIASLPVAMLIIAVLYINEFQDYKADKEVGKDNWVVNLGRERAVYGYFLIVGLCYVLIVTGVTTGVMPLLALISLASIPLFIKAQLRLKTYHSQPRELVPANAATILNHLATGLLLTVAYLVKWGS
jgi:1,4-dihydroxy-2-naphthoate octaprenyltransferase